MNSVVLRQLVFLKLIIAFFLLGAAPAFADPGIAWTYNPTIQRYGTNTIADLVEDPHGNLLLSGTMGFIDDYNWQNRFLSTLLSPTGRVLDMQVYGNSEIDEGVTSFISRNGLSLFGLKHSGGWHDPSSWGTLIGVDRNGNQTFLTSIPPYDSPEVRDALFTATGNLLIVANDETFSGKPAYDTTSIDRDFWSIATLTDPLGEIIWQTWIDPAEDIFMHRAIETLDGGFLLLGTTSHSPYHSSFLNPALTVWKLDRYGLVEFTRELPEVPAYYFSTVAAEKKDGSFLLFSVSDDGRLLVNRISPQGDDLGQSRTRKLGDGLRLTAITAGQGQGWLLSGFTQDNNYYLSKHFYLLRVDANGVLTGDFLRENPYEYYTQTAGTAIATADGGYAVIACYGSIRNELVKLDGDNFELEVTVIEVDLDMGKNNQIVLNASGLVDVAILTTEDLDAATVDPASVRFAGAALAATGGAAKLLDVNGDKQDDLLLQFRMDELQLTVADREAALEGETLDGQAIAGETAVTVKESDKK